MAGNKVRIPIQVDAKKATKDVKKFGKDTEKAFKAMSKSMTSMNKIILAGKAAFSAIVGIKVVGWIQDQLTEWVNLAANIQDVSDRLGIGIEELQEWQYVAEASGISTETFNMALQRMTRRVAEAAVGTGEAAGALRELNINAEELAQLPLDQQLERIMDGLRGVAIQGHQARVAMKFFDSEGVKMIQMLKRSKEDTKAFILELKALGGIMGVETVEQVQKHRENVIKMKAAWLGLKTEVMPVLAEFAVEVINIAHNAWVFWKSVFTGDEMDKLRANFFNTQAQMKNSAKRIKKNEEAIKKYQEQIDSGDLGLLKTIWANHALSHHRGLLKANREEYEELQKALKGYTAELEAAQEGFPGGEKPAGEQPKAKGPTAEQRAKAELDAVNNTRAIMISFEEDERVRAERLVEHKIRLINQEYDAKVAIYGKTAALRNELHAKELQAFQERDDTLEALDQEALDRKIERQEQWLTKQKETLEAEKNARIEAQEQFLEQQQQMEEFMNVRDESVYQRQITQVGRTAEFYGKQIELAKAAGATEEQIEQMKYNTKKDLGMAALKDAQQLALAYAAQSKNAWRVYKATAIAQALVDTYRGTIAAFQAMAGIFPAPLWGILAGAAAFAWGMTRVQMIRQQERPSAAEGGVFSGPTSGYPATLHGTEAVVPLPGGRAIPVEGAGGGTLQVNITATDSQSFTDLVARNPQAIIGPLVEQMQLGNRNLISTMQDTTREE